MGSVIGAELPILGMQISRGAEAGDWQFGWQGVKGWTYFLQQSSNILEWSYLPWIASGNDGPLGLTVRSSASAGFFRWRATDRSVADPWTADFDVDGVSNGDELLQGTDPLSAADGDANSLPDDWEQFYFQRIGVDPHATAPGGGMTTLQHFTLGSNPTHPPPIPVDLTKARNGNPRKSNSTTATPWSNRHEDPDRLAEKQPRKERRNLGNTARKATLAKDESRCESFRILRLPVWTETFCWRNTVH